MLTSTSDRAYVWVWLPGASTPVTAGVVQEHGAALRFQYGARYLERPDAVSLYGPELPLQPGWFGPQKDLGMPGAIRDGSPDAWGRRVILNRLTGNRGVTADTGSLSELTYLLHSGSSRLGALDFQKSATEYIPRADTAPLDDLYKAAKLVEAGEPVPEALSAALMSGTAMGGARPKAVLESGGREYIAKFCTTSDTFSVVGAEAASIALARSVGIDVPAAEVVTSLRRNVIVMERFDRTSGGGRLMVVSGQTMLGLGEMTSRYGTYPQLLDVLRQHGAHPDGVGRQLFQRIAFNIAISNTDDHLRNHAAFWGGQHLALTPAYDLSPMNRSGETATQVLAFGRDGERQSSFAELLSVSHVYGLSKKDAEKTIDSMVDVIHHNWDAAADAGRLTSTDKSYLWGRQILNPVASYGYGTRPVATGWATSSGSQLGWCGAWMPRAREKCVLPLNHGGHHRSVLPK